MYVGVDLGVGDGVTVAYLSGGNDGEGVAELIAELGDEVFRLVEVTVVDALAVHDAEFIGESLKRLSVDEEAEVTTCVPAEERVAAAAGEVGDAL